MSSIDIVKAVEAQDANALKTVVDNTLSKKAFEKLEDIKKDIASSFLNVDKEEDNVDEDL